MPFDIPPNGSFESYYGCFTLLQDADNTWIAKNKIAIEKFMSDKEIGSNIGMVKLQVMKTVRMW